MTAKLPSQQQTHLMSAYYLTLNQIKSITAHSHRPDEYKGKPEHHEYELYLQIEGIDHTNTQVRSQ